MPAQWTGELVGKMHMKQVTKKELATFMGITAEYVGRVLNGKDCPKNAEQTFRSALEALLVQRSTPQE